MQLIIDNREHALIDSCNKYLATINNKSTIIEIQTLDLGDAIIKRTGVDILVIERKTISDLLASIKDGRYEEQSHRLANASGVPTHHVIYIIEGFLSSVNAFEKKVVLSTLTSLNVFKGFSIMRTANVHETAELLINMCDKIGRDYQKGRIPRAFLKDSVIDSVSTNMDVPTGVPTTVLAAVPTTVPTGVPTTVLAAVPTTVPIDSYSSVVKKVKKENLTSANMAEIILCQIPGISSKTASVIIAKNKADGGGSLLQLLKCLEENPKYLDDILLETGRKINKNCSAKISEFLV
jgi:ERCC4-type nuclease